MLSVKLALGAVGVGAGTSGATITTSIAAATDAIYTNTSTGVSTSSTSEEAGTATGSTMYVYAATPTITKSELTGSELDLLAGTKVLSRFTVSSNGGTIAWKEVLFDITKIAAPTITSPTLWDVTGGGNTQVTAVLTFQNDTNADAHLTQFVNLWLLSAQRPMIT